MKKFEEWFLENNNTNHKYPLLLDQKPTAYLVEFDYPITDDHSKRVSVIEREAPTGYYFDCSTPLYTIS